MVVQLEEVVKGFPVELFPKVSTSTSKRAPQCILGFDCNQVRALSPCLRQGLATDSQYLHKGSSLARSLSKDAIPDKASRSTALAIVVVVQISSWLQPQPIRQQHQFTPACCQSRQDKTVHAPSSPPTSPKNQVVKLTGELCCCNAASNMQWVRVHQRTAQ